MKRLLKCVSVAAMVIGLMFLFSCSKTDHAYEKRINEFVELVNTSAEKGKPITLNAVKTKLGEDIIEVLILNSGYVIAIKDCKTYDELKVKYYLGEDIEGIFVSIQDGKAVFAKYCTHTDDFKDYI